MIENAVSADVPAVTKDHDSTCPSMRAPKPVSVPENKELSACELFRKAYEKQAKEFEATLLPVFHVNISYIVGNSSQKNYTLDIILASKTCTCDYYILNWEFFKNYAYMATATISHGQLILELLGHRTRISLVDNYIHQVHADNAMYNITVSKKKMAK